MAAPRNPRDTTPPYLSDSLLNFKFLILWEGKLVAGVSKVGALSRPTDTAEFRAGGAPQIVRKIPGQTDYSDITLERGLIIDPAFEQWANKVWFYEGSGSTSEVSLKDFRKDITIQLCNQAGQIVKQYLVFNCWPSQYQALPELDSNSNHVALETLTLANEGWQRDDSFLPGPGGVEPPKRP